MDADKEPAMYRVLKLVFMLIMLASIAHAGVPDHPLLSKYENAGVRGSSFVDYSTISIPISQIDAEDSLNNKTLTLTGDITRHTYAVEQTSSLKVFKNYHNALSQSGFSFIYQCELTHCGSKNQLNELAGLVSLETTLYDYHQNPYYMVVKKQGNKGTIYIAILIVSNLTNTWVFQNVIEEKALELGLVKVNAEYLTQPPNVTIVNSISDTERAKDHKLISRYPNAFIREMSKVDYSKLTLPISSLSGNSPYQYKNISITGDVTKHTYSIENTSSLKVFKNYQNAIHKAGFNKVYQCELSGCGTVEHRTVIAKEISLEYSIHDYQHDPYYLVYKKTAEEGDVYLAVLIISNRQNTWVLQSIVEEEVLEADLVTVSLDLLSQQLEQRGKALLYGVYFDTDKSIVKPESKPSMAVVAELLNTRKELSLYVVGHTDDSGLLNHNTQLSEQRAQAVVQQLVEKYKIESTRLIAIGMGPYAPESTNISDKGKKLNRRVELVQRLQ